MPWNGNGTFTEPVAPEFPAVAGDLIRAEYFNTVIRALCSGFSNTLPRDGQAVATGDVNLGNLFKVVNMAAATADGQAVRYQEFVASLAAFSVAGYTELRAYAATSKYIYVTGYLVSAAPLGIAGMFVLDTADVTSADNGGTIIVTALGKRYKRIFDGKVNVQWFGAKGNSTDEFTAISNALTYVRGINGVLFFPQSSGDYSHSGTLVLGASSVGIEGDSPEVRLNYTGTGTGLIINSSYASPQRERCSIRNITLYSTTGAVAFDWTGSNYGNYTGFEINYTAANAKLLYAIGSSGAGPYFNQFSGFTLFGGADRSQYGIWLASDTSGNLADGPNANIFSDIKRAASLFRFINIMSGHGNLFSNGGGESIKDSMIVLNDVLVYADTGTATATTTNSLTDTTKVWSATIGAANNWTNGAVVITSGPFIGAARKILINTATALTLDKSWPDNIGTPTYALVKSKAIANKFVNFRQEGLASDNPEGVRIMPGALANECVNFELGSLGSGKPVDDQYGEPTNKVNIGDLMIYQYILVDPGASATKTLIPRLSVFGGIRAGAQMALEYIELSCPDYTAGVATLTVDHGGSATGNGSETLTVKVNSFNTKEAFTNSKAKTMRSTVNNGIFASVVTDAAFSATSDIIVTIAFKVL